MDEASQSLLEIEKKFYDTFCYKNFVGASAITHDLDFCVENLTAYCQITRCADDPVAASKIDWIAHVILMRDSVMSHRDMKMLSEQERDRKRRTLNIVSDKVSNFVINKYLYLHQIDSGETKVSYLSRLIYHADLYQIKRINYAIWVKAEYRIVLKPLPLDVTDDDLENAWKVRLDISKLGDFTSNMLVTTARQSRGQVANIHTSHARADSSSSSVKHPRLPHPASSTVAPLPSYHPQSSSLVQRQPASAYVHYMSNLDRQESCRKYPGMENFIIEQLAIYCQSRRASHQGEPTDWMGLLPLMREYCSHTPTFFEPDLKKRYRVHNLFVDNVAHFVVNKFIQLNKMGFSKLSGNDDDIEEDGYENYLNKLVKNSKSEHIQELNYVLFIKDDSRYPIKPIPPATTKQQISDAWDARVSMVVRLEDSSVDGMLMKLPLHLGRRAQILSCESFTNPVFKQHLTNEDDDEEERKETEIQQTAQARQRMSGLGMPHTYTPAPTSAIKKVANYANVLPDPLNVIHQPPQKKQKTSKTILAAKILLKVGADVAETASTLTMSAVQAYARDITEAAINDSSDDCFSDDDDAEDKFKRLEHIQEKDTDYTTYYLEHLEIMKQKEVS